MGSHIQNIFYEKKSIFNKRKKKKEINQKSIPNECELAGKHSEN